MEFNVINIFAAKKRRRPMGLALREIPRQKPEALAKAPRY